MGTLRVILALCVVAWHIDDRYPIPINGYLAVTGFYIISGFYMSMVINEKYRDGVASFYFARFLRLFPLYWLICLATIVFWLAMGADPIRLFSLDLPPSMWAPTLLANFGIFGLDGLVMMRATEWNGLNILRLVGPAWSLGIELQFYLVAPFIVTRSIKFIVGVLLACLAIRFSLLGWPYDPWRYFFAPAVWCFFILGVLAHRIIRPRRETAAELGGVAAVVLLGAVAICGTYEVKDIDSPELWLFCLVFAGSVPLIFAWTKQVRWDNEIGKLSYPLYLVHPLIIAIVAQGVKIKGLHWGWHLVAFLASILAAIAAHWLVEAPIDRWQSRVKRQRLAPGE